MFFVQIPRLARSLLTDLPGALALLIILIGWGPLGCGSSVTGPASEGPPISSPSPSQRVDTISATQDGYRVQLVVAGGELLAHDTTDLRFTVTNVGDTVASGGVGGPVEDAPLIAQVTHPSWETDRTSPKELSGGRYHLACVCGSPGTATIKVELHFAWVHSPPSPVSFWFDVPVRKQPG